MALAPQRRSRKQSTPRRFSRGRPYRRARAAHLNSDATNHLCAECLRQGVTAVATELDHIKRAAEFPELFWDSTNWQWLCQTCHELKTQRENGTGKN